MGEAARQPDAPYFPKNPEELFVPREGGGYTFKDKYAFPVTCALTGALMQGARNLLHKRPYWAGIQFYFLLSIGGYFIGDFIQQTRLEYKAEDNAMYKQYISLHPEDFLSEEPKRIKDVFEPWCPVR